MNRHKYILLLLFMLATSLQVAAQGLVVKNFYHAERDFTANSGRNLIKDQNDEPCALIKVRTMQKGLTFDAGRLFPIEKTEEQGGDHPLDIYVWVQNGAKRFSIGHPQLGVLSEYDLQTTLLPGQTYILELVTGEVQTIVKQARTTQYVVFQLTPPEAVVELDGEMLASSGGTAQKLMPFGSYQYTVKAPNYQMEVGRIKVDDPKNKHVVTVSLKPNFAAITLTAPSGAEIWVDEERKGTGSWTGNLGAGAHIFEARLAGHHPSQRNYDLVVANGPQTITLEAPTPIVGEAEITSDPALADIYIDGKKVGQTPQLVSDLLVGSHSIKLSRKGYADYTATLSVKEGETASLAATMKKQETQGLVVKKFYHAERDITANSGSTLVLDMNEEPCALIKVRTNEHGFTFDAGRLFPIEKTEEQGGDHPLDIYVWVQSGAKRLSIGHPQLGVLSEYDLQTTLLPGQTYILELVTGEVQTMVELDGLKLKTPAIGGSASAAVGGNSAPNASGNLTFTVKGVTFTMVKVEAGTFTMGATSEQGSEAYDREKPAHKVTLTKDYYIGQTEVTQALWQAVMGRNPSEFKGDNLPVEKVSRVDCQKFISKLNSLTGSKFRLPTEAEWEYAARGGNKSRGYKYSGSNSIDDVAWYTKTTNDKGTKPVATKAANELGLYDMSGNVLEWCNDWYGVYSSSAQTDPTGPTSGSDRVFRGGSWYNEAAICRVACRSCSSPSYRNDNLGFRLAL